MVFWILPTAIVFIFGLGFGSFLNVLIWRLNDEKAPKFWQGRSICPNCRHELSWRDNIPLLSFLLLGGKCRYCRRKISLQYPIVEIVTATSFVLVWFLFSNQLDLFVKLDILAITASFIVIFFSDWIYGLIPDEMIVTGTLGAILFIIYHLSFSILGQNLLVGVLSSLGFLLIVVATRFRGMGLGDVKLAFLMGFLLGWPRVGVAFWSAFILGGTAAVFLMLLHRKKFHDTMALGPYLVIGTIIGALWSGQVLQLIGL